MIFADRKNSYREVPALFGLLRRFHRSEADRDCPPGLLRGVRLHPKARACMRGRGLIVIAEKPRGLKAINGWRVAGILTNASESNVALLLSELVVPLSIDHLFCVIFCNRFQFLQ